MWWWKTFINFNSQIYSYFGYFKVCIIFYLCFHVHKLMFNWQALYINQMSTWIIPVIKYQMCICMYFPTVAFFLFFCKCL